MPLGECSADGSLVITKPEGTGGLVSVGTVSEQLLYEVSDPQRYYVADVVCDFTDVRMEQVGPDRVAVTGARGLGRTATYKASLTYDAGWRATVLIPVIGLESGAKARRVGEELIARTSTMLRQSQLPPWTQTRCDVIGGEGPGATTAICRLVADHPDQEGAQLLVREQSSAISHMSVGISLGLGASTRPVQRIVGFLIPKSSVSQSVSLDGAPVPFVERRDASGDEADAIAPPMPKLPEDADPAITVPLIRLAWARSGDKGNLFNVAVIARQPEYLPYIAAALTPQTVGQHYGRVLGHGSPLDVDCFSLPGLCALNFLVKSSMDGGVLASTSIDPVAKGMAQLLLDFPVPVSVGAWPQPERLKRRAWPAGRCGSEAGLGVSDDGQARYLAITDRLNSMLFAGCLPDFAGCIGIHRGDGQPDDKIGPGAAPDQRGDDPCRYDSQIGQRIVARGEERGPGQAAAVVANAGEHQGTAEIDRERAKPGQNQRHGLRCQRQIELLPGREQSCQSGNQQDHGQHHPHPRPSAQRPAQRGGNQQIDRGIFEKIDAIGKQRDRSNCQCDRKLDPEPGKIEQCDYRHNPANSAIFTLRTGIVHPPRS